MAYHQADPHSFVPLGLQTQNIPHRDMMARAVVCHIPRTHEDYYIVSLNPLPLNAPMNFPTVQDVLFEFFEDHLRIPLRECQPSHLGQALVRFENAHARDILVNQSPFQFGDVQVSLVRHNEGWNWRALQFNIECWLMLMGFPLDHWNYECIQSAIGSFSQLLL
jgi:hypothetical protein